MLYVTGVEKGNEIITIYTSTVIISFPLFKEDTLSIILSDIYKEFVIANKHYLEKLLKIVLNSRFFKII
jgi:hypothetical protein